MTSKKIKFVLTPSTIGQYFENKCDRFLLCKCVKGEVLRIFGWSVPGEGDDKTASAIAGSHWEAILLSRLSKDKNSIVKNLKEMVGTGRSVTLEDTIKVLKSLKSTKKVYYIYQANIHTKRFDEKYLSNNTYNSVNAAMSDRIFPDFIKAEYDENKGKYKLTIVDAKNAGQLKRGAVIQVAIYAEVLKLALENTISNCYVNDEEGIIWNREKVSDERVDRVFSLKSASKEFKDFFGSTVPKLCNALSTCENGVDLANNVEIRVSQMCEYCNRFDDCKARCIRQKSFHLLPYLPVEAQDRVYDLIDNGDVEIDTTLESVMSLLHTQPELLTEGCSYWNIVKHNRNAYSDAMNELFEPQQYNNHRYPKPNAGSISLPEGQNISLFLTAQQDVDSGRMYAYSWLLKPGHGIAFRGSRLNRNGYVDIKDNFDTSGGYKKYYNTYIVTKCPWKKDKNGKDVIDRTEFDKIDRKFAEGVYKVLKKISRLRDTDSRKLQIYVMDRYEYINIENALYNMLDYLDPETDQGLELINKVMAIIFCFQGVRIATDAMSVPETVLDNPVCVLTSEISKLYALPAGVAYSLRDIAPLFEYRTMNYNFPADQKTFFEPLANVVNGRKILDIWDPENGNKAENIRKLRYHITRRLFVEMKILLAIQNDCRRDRSVILCDNPSPYEHYELDFPDSSEAARLVYENCYEELLDYKAYRSRRLLGPDYAVEKGAVLELEYRGENRRHKVFIVHNHEAVRAVNWFTPWFCKDTPDNRRNLMKFSERNISGINTRYTIRGTGSTFYPCRLNMNLDFEETAGEVTLIVSPKDLDEDFELRTGGRYLLFDAYADYNSYKTNAALELLEERPELTDPGSLCGNTGISYDEQRPYFESCIFSDGHWFSKSQKTAFKHLVERRLTVLVGPPATGKTDFIARSIISLARFYKDAFNKNLKIMVTAMSHSAIENVLLKLDKLNYYDDIKLLKAEKIDDEAAFTGTDVKRVKTQNHSKDKAPLLTNELKKNEIQIIGMTCWAAYNAFISKASDQEPFAFDMIVMEEASQVRTMDAFLNLECSDDDTRFLLVGDDDQLPAIFKGKYTQREGEKYIFGSVFRMFLTGLREGLDYPNDDHQDIVELSENFRMNSILCKYAAMNIYNESYKAYNDEIGNRKITLRSVPDDPFTAFVLDEDYPLVFCELSGDAASQTETEVELVTRLVRELWNKLQNNEDGSLAKMKGNFWQPKEVNGISYEGACGIISPHHEHIRRLRNSIHDIPLTYQNRRLNKKDIYIGTVDKLQGKERLAVIVSYGMADKEKIRHEAEFIFSRNRFNVSLTRGKGKTIVFLSDALAEPNLNSEVLSRNDKELEKGIGYIHGFSKYMKTSEDDENMRESDVFTFGNVKVKVWKKKKA